MIPSVAIKPGSMLVGHSSKSIAWKFVFKLHPELTQFQFPVAVSKPLPGAGVSISPSEMKRWAQDAMDIHIARWKDTMSNPFLATHPHSIAQTYFNSWDAPPPLPHVQNFVPTPIVEEVVVWPEEPYNEPYDEDNEEEEP